MISSYCVFQEVFSNLKNIEEIKCLCLTKLKNKNSFQSHKKHCKTFSQYEKTYYEYALEQMPKNLNCTSDNGTIKYCGAPEIFFNSFQSNYILSSSSKSKGVSYKKIQCFAHKINECSFFINVTYTEAKIHSINCHGFHNHSSDEEFFDSKTKQLVPLNSKKTKMCESTKNSIINLFYEGETPTTALEKFKLSFAEDYQNASRDRSLIPDLRSVYSLFEKEKSINFGSANISEFDIEKFQADNQHIKLKFCRNPDGGFIIAFCNELMLGAAQSPLASNIICIDSTSGMDRSNGHLFNLIVPGPVGSLSIGMFITFSETVQSITLGLEILKLLLQENGISCFNPKFFMSDDSSAQKAAIKNNFPSATILLCQFHVVQALWRWLQSNALKSTRVKIVNLFRKCMYTTSNYEDSKIALYNEIQNDPKLSSHFDRVFVNEKQFATFYRKEFNLGDVNTNNIIENSFLVIKSKYLERSKVFNILHLIQKISENYTSFQSLKLIDFKNGRAKYFYRYFKDINKEILVKICDSILTFKFTDEGNRRDDDIDLYIESENFPQTDVLIDSEETLNEENFDKALGILKVFSNKPEYAKLINTWAKRVVNSKTDSQLSKIIATGGGTAKKILQTQSRISKSSHKNRFKDLAVKSKNSKPRCLASSIRNNVRNKLTQSKK